MKLSDAASIASLQVQREGEFGSLGQIGHDAPAMLTCLYDERYLEELLGKANVTCAITSERLAERLPARWGVAVADDPRRAFYVLHNHLHERTDFYWQHFPAEIAPDARIHPTAYVAAQDVRIGRRTVIEPHVTILERSLIGDDVIIRAGAVVGSQGFEFKRFGQEVFAVAHAGGVRLGDRVEVQANCAISRAVFGGFTELGDDTKLDNLVHVAHNVRIGRRCLLAACAMVAGTVTIGDDVWVGPGATISSGLRIGDRASITLGAVVTRDVASGQRVTGHFAIDHDKFIAFMRTIR